MGRQQIAAFGIELGLLHGIDDNGAGAHDEADDSFLKHTGRPLAHGQRPGHGIRRAHGDGQARRQAEAVSTGGVQCAGGAFRRPQLRQQRRIEVPEGAERGIDRAIQSKDAIARRGGGIGHLRPRQRVAEIILGREDAPESGAPVMPMEAIHGHEIAPVDGHARPPIERGAAPLIQQPRRPAIGAAVAPGDGRAQRPIGTEADQGGKLACKADTGDTALPIPAELSTNLRHGGTCGIEPVTRLLLRLAGRIGDGRKCGLAAGDRLAAFVNDGGLDGGGAEIDSEAERHVSHGREDTPSFILGASRQRIGRKDSPRSHGETNSRLRVLRASVVHLLSWVRWPQALARMARAVSLAAARVWSISASV